MTNPQQRSSSQFWLALAVTAIVAIVWSVLLIERNVGQSLPSLIYRIANFAAIGFAGAWLVAAALGRKTQTEAANQMLWWIGGSLLILFGWQTLVFELDNAGFGEARATIARWGTAGIFLVGLLWWVWIIERLARRQREAEAPAAWNPFNEKAWFYGQAKNKKLNQSMSSLLGYTVVFCVMFLVLTNIRGCQEVYDLPAGGGERKQLVQKVKIKKVIRKKYVVNPYSAIKFDERIIDDVNLQLNELTEHTYTIGQGAGAGAGFGSGTPGGKVRFIRLEYSGGDWDQDFGVGGDLNMLNEYAIRTSHKIEKRTESRRVAELANFKTGPAMIYLTGQRNISLSNNEVKILRAFIIDRHGMIFCDNGGSRHFHNQFLSMMTRILPDVRPVPVPLDDTIHKIPYSIPFLPYVAPHGGKDALGWYKDGRWVCYYHPGDIGDAWADGHAGVKAEVWEGCYQLGTNVIFYAHAEFDKWQRAQRKEES